MIQQAQQLLETTFGYSEFRHDQAAIIESLLNGQDVMALMPTGGGKSLCYQIPSLLRAGTGIVVSPLIALMQDQVDALTQLGIRAAFINSSLQYHQVQATEQALLNNQLDLLYVAPERLLMPGMLELLDQSELALFAIDEAHCVSQWGHDFRPEYQQLSLLAERFPQVPRIALTATADKRTQDEIVAQLALQQAAIYISSFDRPNIRYAIAEGQNARQQLWRFLQHEHPEDAGIIYCLSRKKVEDTAAWLSQQGRVALPYHAGLSNQQRQHHQERFLREENIIVVATIAFGMGIDKPDVRFVAHLNLPKSIEAYYQETGRAGRDGQAANAWMAYGLQDVITLRQFMDDSGADEQHKRVVHHKLEAMLGLCELTSCRRQALLEYFGESLAQPCGNCDNCQIPPETWDATVAAQKALSCVYRTGQRFGVNYLIDVLTGKNNERIQRFGHNRLSTFNIGADLTQKEWRGIYRQLIARGYISIDVEHFGALHLTEQARPLLKGEIQLMLRKQRAPEAKPKRGAARKSHVSPLDEPLWEALRNLRLELANAQGVPPFVIFHDATLQHMMQLRPDSIDAMSEVSGIGSQKLAQYGEEFLKVLQQFPRSELYHPNLSDTIFETLQCHSQGLSPEAIAAQRGLTEDTVYKHFAEAIELGVIAALDVLPINEQELAEIHDAMDDAHFLEEGKLKPVFEALDEQYSYGVLRCVAAAL